MVTTHLRRGSKRQTIKATIVGWIREQKLAPGDRIAGQNELARRFRTTPVTVVRALGELAAEGVLHRRNGSGTYVGSAPSSRSDSSVAASTICLILPGADLDRPENNPYYWPYVQTLLHSFASTLGHEYTLSVRAVAPGTDPRKVADEFRDCRAVFFHHSKEPRDLLQYLIRKRIAPVVAFGLPAEDIACLTVDHDRREGARRGVAYLAGIGYRRIGFIGSRESWGEASFQGYRQALTEVGLAFAPERVIRIGESIQREGFRGMAELVENGLPVDGVFVDSDTEALGAIECLRQRGLRVPQDVGVMGYDGLEFANLHPPYLTSVEIPNRKLIEAALAIVNENSGKPTPKRHVWLTGNVLPGQTVVRRVAISPDSAALPAPVASAG